MAAIAPMTPDPASPNMARRHKQVAPPSSFITNDSVLAIPSPSLDLSVLRWSPKTGELPEAEPGGPATPKGEDDAMSSGRPTRAGAGRPLPRAPKEPDTDAPSPAPSP